MLYSIEGLELFESWDVGSTIKSLEEINPDILLLDIIMPEESGISVLKYLNSVNIKIAVIVLTNYSNTATRRECLENGADYFFDKSTEHKKAVNLIRRMVLDSAGKRKDSQDSGAVGNER